MKILWLCNVIPPVIAKQLNTETTVKEGWIDAALKRMLSDKDKDITLGICAPTDSLDSPYKKDALSIEDRQITVYRFLEQTQTPWVYDKTLDVVFADVIADFTPDMIHIFGTEYPHATACAKAFKRPDRLLIGIQGVMRACAEEYCGGLPKDIVNSSTFRDRLKKDNIADQQTKFELRAGFEKQTLENAGHATGRTEFDRKEVLNINPKLIYHHMNETMRAEFYEGKWDPDRLNDNVIFVSQADYPLKGFHVLMEAMPYILKAFPKTKIWVAGNSITGYRTLKEKIKIGGYGKYLRKLAVKNGLEDRITVLGKLSASEMRERYENSSVYICTSYVENSPNSLGEAMLVGTPSIAARVGGIPSVASKEEVTFFDKGDAKQLAECVIGLFSDKDKAVKMAEAAKKRAEADHDANKNFERLMEIYKEICLE
ncbi:MAG: glycosyltransferase family 4 protein [Lachnospiraceae bacterium]|nr:glycosyltransferase family 4 protein [Lachnospiraceae bacterium]